MTAEAQRDAGADATIYEFGPFRFEPRENRLLRGGLPVPLPPRGIETLRAMVERSGSLISKQELLERVWPDRIVEENSVAKCVSELRRALDDGRSEPRYIETVAKRGYRFVAEVRRRRDDAVLPVVAPPAGTGSSGSVGSADVSLTLRVTVELVAGGTPLWTGRSGGRLTEPITVGDAIAERVAAALTGGQGGGERRALRRRASQDRHAFRLYREARCHVLRYTSAGWRKSVSCYEQAIAQDPAFALAHADLAISSVLACVYYTSSEECRQRARNAARRALALDPGLPEAHLAIALVRYLLDQDWDGAESAFHQALALDPEQAWSHDYFGFFLLLMGRFREALPPLERAVELNPVRILVNGDLGLYHHFTGAVEGCLDHHRRALDLNPFCGLTRVDFARALERAGRPREAMAEIRKTLRLDDAPWVRVWLARACALAGQREEAQRLLRQLTNASRRAPVSPVFLALVHTALGERAAAFALLEEAIAQRSSWTAFLRVEPGFDPLREEPRFAALLRRAGLES